MRVLITGATGYLGASVAATLVAAGHEVTALCRPGRETLLPAGCGSASGDLRDRASLRRALEGREALVHMAAMVQKWSRHREEFDRINVDGTASILEAASETGVRKILYTSSIVALGPTEGAPADEDRPRSTGGTCTDYERTKWRGLQVVRSRSVAGQPIVVVYPGVVYGPGAPTEGNLLLDTLRDYVRGRLRGRLGRGDLRICYAFAEDVARGHLLALERGVAGRGYILGGENATQDDLFRTLHALTGLASPPIAVPYWLAEALGSLMVLTAHLTGRPPSLTPGVVATFRHEWAYRSERAEREIGYSVTPLSEGLRRTLESLRPGVTSAATPGGAPRAGDGGSRDGHA
jgi:farnesol dehydrogenase